MLEQILPGNVCQPLEDPHIDACPTGSGNSVQEEMQKTVTTSSQLQSSHSETNRHTSGEGEKSVLMLFSIELAMVSFRINMIRYRMLYIKF